MISMVILVLRGVKVLRVTRLTRFSRTCLIRLLMMSGLLVMRLVILLFRRRWVCYLVMISSWILCLVIGCRCRIGCVLLLLCGVRLRLFRVVCC